MSASVAGHRKRVKGRVPSGGDHPVGTLFDAADHGQRRERERGRGGAWPTPLRRSRRARRVHKRQFRFSGLEASPQQRTAEGKDSRAMVGTIPSAPANTVCAGAGGRGCWVEVVMFRSRVRRFFCMGDINSLSAGQPHFRAARRRSQAVPRPLGPKVMRSASQMR